jgi:hypothetical protein
MDSIGGIISSGLVLYIVYNHGMIFLSLNNNSVSIEFERLILFCILYCVPIQFGNTHTKDNQTVWCVDAGRRHRSEHDTISYFSWVGFWWCIWTPPYKYKEPYRIEQSNRHFLSFFLYFLYSPFALVSSKPDLLLCKLLDGVSCALGCLADPRATLSVSPQ